MTEYSQPLTDGEFDSPIGVQDYGGNWAALVIHNGTAIIKDFLEDRFHTNRPILPRNKVAGVYVPKAQKSGRVLNVGDVVLFARDVKTKTGKKIPKRTYLKVTLIDSNRIVFADATEADIPIERPPEPKPLVAGRYDTCEKCGMLHGEGGCIA